MSIDCTIIHSKRLKTVNALDSTFIFQKVQLDIYYQCINTRILGEERESQPPRI